MDQWIAQLFDNGFIELGFGTKSLKIHLFMQIGGDIAHQALELAEGAADGQHPDTQSAVTQLFGEALHLFGDGLQFTIITHGSGLAEA